MTKDIYRVIGEAIGEASMCWKEAPTGEFDSLRAGRIVDDLYASMTPYNEDYARIEQKVDALDAKLTAVLASVDEIIEQAKPAFDQLMSSPLLAMISGGKKNGR